MVGTRSLPSAFARPVGFVHSVALGTVITASAVGTAPVAPVQNCGGSGAIPGRSRAIGTIARHSIEALNSADDRLVVRYGPTRSAAGRRIPGGTHAEAINTSTNVPD